MDWTKDDLEGAGYNSSRQPQSFAGNSLATEVPHDDEGIPFLRASGGHPLDHKSAGLGLNLGDLFGRSQKNAKHIPHSEAIPAWEDVHGTKPYYYYSLKDVIGYMKNQTDPKDKIRYADRIKHLEGVRSSALKDISEQRNRGQDVPSLTNQRHRNNRGFHIRATYMPQGRQQYLLSKPHADRREDLGVGSNTSNTAAGGGMVTGSDAMQSWLRNNPTNPGAPTVDPRGGNNGSR